MIFLFWLCLGLIVYCYFLYPLLLWIFAKFFEQPVQKSPQTPSVSVVMSVWNEEDVIGKKLKNFLSLDYPKDQFEILVGSDGSTDQTNTIIKQFDDTRVRLIELEGRNGKMVTINHLVNQAKHDIIVFTDARQIFESQTIRELVANFSDPKVGCVSGELVFYDKEGGTARGINLYWKYEKFMRNCEARIHSMLGATGAIYAIRKELYREVPHDIVLDDMYIPFQIIKQGYRAIFDGTAKAFDEVADNPKEEYSRKARTLFGNYQIFKRCASMFIPIYSPVSIQFFSHKFLRVIVPFLMIAIFIINILLFDNLFYKMVFFLQIAFYTMALIGALAREQKYGIFRTLSRVCYVPYVFCLLNFSALIGFFRYMGSNQKITWDKARTS